MTTVYTKITKPSGTPYTKISGGHLLYDDSMTTYDQSNVTYDGNNHQSQWTKVLGTAGTASGGTYYGFGAFTYSGGQRLTDIWTDIPKGV